ncbi:hypothetical protein NKR23_g11082 [Pleurostoma richardsiae]|uniref:DUF3835 domain-containing protein n=1 Tax=Pleurostoma richardsiae TaxID=41990 RepID=A0AA38R471_9PEZI|nr:hypothetical protein NKR23_g11082 [Pleurostoma richardsiae]
MAAVKDSFLDLERHIQLLEQNVERLRNALQHWQLWEAEYEALKEEIESLPAPVGRKDLARIRRDFDGQIVNQKEVAEIIGATNFKEPEKIVNILSRRIDYVSQNVGTLEKQLGAAENKLAAATIVSNPDVRHEDGEAVTDIIEQLDDDDNVLSYRIQKPGDVKPQLLEALEKAGIKDLPGLEQKPETVAEENRSGEKREDGSARSQVLASTSDPAPEAEVPSKRPTLKKTVSFAEDTKPGHDTSEDEEPTSTAAKRLQSIMQKAREQQLPGAEPPVIPIDESDEDAELRREMLRYGMSDIAPIVAELAIESDESDDEGYDDGEDGQDDDDDEDQYGRYKYSVIDDDYRQRMLELEKRLGVESSTSSRDQPETAVPEEGVGRITVVSESSQNGAAAPGSNMKKPKQPKAEARAVRFSESLDIAPDEVRIQPTDRKSEAQVNPVSDVVVEGTRKVRRNADTQPKKVSRFRKDLTTSTMNGERNNFVASTTIGTSVPKGPTDVPSRFLDDDTGVSVAPSGPEGKTIAEQVLERDVPAEPKAPDEFDAALIHQEAAVEYHRMRNRLIQKEGGFMKEDENPIRPLSEEEGGPKRMSRFKAARLSRQ